MVVRPQCGSSSTVQDLIGIISNGNRTEWSPIRSVILRVINKTRSSDLFNHEYDYRLNWRTQSSVTN